MFGLGKILALYGYTPEEQQEIVWLLGFAGCKQQLETDLMEADLKSVQFSEDDIKIILEHLVKSENDIDPSKNIIDAAQFLSLQETDSVQLMKTLAWLLLTSQRYFVDDLKWMESFSTKNSLALSSVTGNLSVKNTLPKPTSVEPVDVIQFTGLLLQMRYREIVKKLNAGKDNDDFMQPLLQYYDPEKKWGKEQLEMQQKIEKMKIRQLQENIVSETTASESVPIRQESSTSDQVRVPEEARAGFFTGADAGLIAAVKAMQPRVTKISPAKKNDRKPVNDSAFGLKSLITAGLAGFAVGVGVGITVGITAGFLFFADKRKIGSQLAEMGPKFFLPRLPVA